MALVHVVGVGEGYDPPEWQPLTNALIFASNEANYLEAVCLVHGNRQPRHMVDEICPTPRAYSMVISLSVNPI
jgi:hypothetical protein